MTADDKRSTQQIETDLERTREELARSVDQLSTMIDPRVQIQGAKDNLKAALDRSKDSAQHAAEGAGAKARSLLEEVKQGDPKAIGTVGAGLAIVAAAVTILARRAR
ncbi:DUF3618 domain-containing protein [Georgenia sunbinii]|uniref:DUF3618 domain-containing protein n=1 Tax=Georgenia sunbinii TaxID=3117728 RepID=UPI002F268D2D